MEKQVKYKHHDIVLAWLNGEEIEGRYSRNNPWEKIIPAENASIVPYFDANWEFRIKPKTKTVWYNLYSTRPDVVYYSSEEAAVASAGKNHMYIETRCIDIPV